MKIAVLASGGVDSSVALMLLKEQGFDVTAFYLKIWLEDELSFLGHCPWEEDLSYLEQICQREQIPLQIVNMQREYWDIVVDYALHEIRAGRTPNSDLLCNSKIKFGKFYDKIGSEYDQIATGHYADKVTEKNHYLLKQPKDTFKDQTYFLAHLNQNQLQRAIFPLTPYTKAEVRALAEKYDLPNQSRKDSQGICFLGKIRYNDFVKEHLGIKKGDLINFDSGEKVGEHNGYWFYTIGQRKGIELSHGPWYVVRKDIARNQVYISNQYHRLDAPRDNFKVEDIHWIAEPPTTEQLQSLRVKVRHGEDSYSADLQLKNLRDGEVKIDRNDQGLASGQFAVFYSEGICLGVGTIKQK